MSQQLTFNVIKAHTTRIYLLIIYLINYILWVLQWLDSPEDELSCLNAFAQHVWMLIVDRILLGFRIGCTNQVI